ncbi:putative late blight resistance protein homolog R1B-12 [Bidens hawaiensis]|uniref:putative late blight resistance protein homolog R1B-12 n=1 Tax=Bidens hawaiensis TaxID=980011 RepID=UPI00404A7AF4
MAYAGIQMFMQKLNQIIHCTDNPFFNNNPEIISERPQLQLLYHDLTSVIKTLSFIDQHQHLEKVKDLKKRFIHVAEEAQYIVDLFLSSVVIRNNGNFHISEGFNPSLNLDDIRRSLKSVEVEFMSMRIDGMKLDSSDRTDNQSVPAQIPITRNSLRSKNVLDEIFIGLDDDVELIRGKLVEDQKKVGVVSIVGMGGIGKTTLATKLFNDAYVKHHFHVRVWVTVSQTYDKRAVLLQILESIGANGGLEEASDSRLRELVHKNLIGKRYLIVIDDIWHIETWDSVKLFFPRDNNGSRILLSTRFSEVAKHANSDGLIHYLKYLNKERSWELLCQKVFHGNECPEWSIKPGMQIVENCKGLPLAVVVIAGVLAKEALREKFWEEIAQRTASHIVGEENGCLETLGLSYNHLPLHLRQCFLYLGGFPEDYLFAVKRLIWLWVAEGFIKEDGNRRLEDIAEGYLLDIIDRNLVIVANKSDSDGAIKACKVHDLVRELCLKKAKEERFILQTERLAFPSHFYNALTTPYEAVRKFIYTNDPHLSHVSTQALRSILWVGDFRFLSDDIAKYFNSFVLLRVLDLYNCHLQDLPKSVDLLVHLRYLAIRCSSKDFPSSICNLWNLQTLIFSASGTIVLPSNISDLVNLRHLWSWNCPFGFCSIEKPMNLQTISSLRFKDDAHSFQKYFPCVKDLRCTTASDKQNDFKSLTCLERLSLWSSSVHGKNHITLPATLKTLALEGCGLPWSDMSIIQSLPNLQVLKLHSYAFLGSCWNTNGQEFRQLKFLRLMWLDIKVWEAYSRSFPCLRRLEIFSCEDLENIPLEIGDIPTLELIQIYEYRESLGESVRRIQEEQQDMGNYNLKFDVNLG